MGARLFGAIGLGLLALTVVVQTALANDINVTIGVGDTRAQINGLTSPNAFVTIKDSGSAIATTTADSVGNFSKLLIAQTPGIHDLSIASQSQTGVTDDPTALSVSYTEHATTAIDVFLAPTLHVPTAILANSSLTLQGETTAGGLVEVYVDQKQPIQVYANGSGAWDVSLPAGSLATGTHSVFAVALDGVGRQSTATATRTFTITALPPPPVSGGVAGPIITIPVPLSPSAPVPQPPKPVEITIQPPQPGHPSTGSRVTIIVQAQDGIKPYDYLIQWGDGTQDTIQSSHDSVKAAHIYLQPGNYRGSVRITDASGKTATNSFDVNVRSASDTGKEGHSFPWPWLLLITLPVIIAAGWWVLARRRRSDEQSA